ncbi:hypothetical protein [Niallia taxi]|uniref:hypothetical protein n=1 Tax=Niallia taxi TaxID=2499688 RepID=UPI0030094864
MTVLGLIGSALSIGVILASAKGIDIVMSSFHTMKLNNKKKGDNNEISHSELLREESRKLR